MILELFIYTFLFCAYFLFAFDQHNITVFAALIRIQMDCVHKTYATILVENSTDFCNKVLYENIIVGRYSDSKGKFLTDKYLCENLEKLLAMDVCVIYSKNFWFYSFLT